MAAKLPTGNRPPLPWKTRLAVAAGSALTDFTRRRDGTINRRLVSFLDPQISPSTTTKGVRSADLVVDSATGVFVRLFFPTPAANDAGRLPVVVFFHGGGFAYLSPASFSYDHVCRRLARRIPAVVVSVGYRLAPEHRYPTAYDDGLAALRFLDSSIASVAPGDLRRCFLAGDSAGANIAHFVARRWAALSDWKELNVLGLITIQPYFGGEERTAAELRLRTAPLVTLDRTDWLWKAFLPEGEDRDHEAANVFGPRGAKLDLGERFPAAVMVVVAGYDPLQDWQRRYYKGLRERGKEARLVEYEDTIHAFYLFPELPQSSALIGKIKDFIHEIAGEERSSVENSEAAKLKGK